jgi:hypothetical protein
MNEACKQTLQIRRGLLFRGGRVTICALGNKAMLRRLTYGFLRNLK